MSPASAHPTIVDRLAILDRLLQRAVDRGRAAFGADAHEDPFRGTYISDAEATRIASGSDATGQLTTDEDIKAAFDALDAWPELDAIAPDPPLSPFDRAVVLIALAPELELRYERLYAYLQDDVTKRRPTVDLTLHLLAPGGPARLALYHRFEGRSPLLTHGLLRLVADPAHVEPPLIAHFLKLDQTVIESIAAVASQQSEATSAAERITPADDADLAGEPLARQLAGLILGTRLAQRRLLVLVTGPAAAPKRDLAAAVARLTGSTFFVVNPADHAQLRGDPTASVIRTARQAAAGNAALFVDGIDDIAADSPANAQAIAATLRRLGGVQFIATDRTWPQATWPEDTVSVTLPPMDYARRLRLWKAQIEASQLSVGPEALRHLASFELMPREIECAVANTRQRLKWRLDTLSGGDGPLVTATELSRAARAHSGADLAGLTRRIEPAYTWRDLVVPPEVSEQLEEICARVIWRDEVLERGGFGAKLSAGKGIATLFSGPPGTGKTMAAEVLANRLGLDLFRVDLSTVVSKYIGETEKNMERIFRAADRSNCVLLLDEGEALCGKRSEVRDAHDRYANIEISYLLQRMEMYEGLTILTTNLRGNIDEAFLRRLAFSVHFPLPSPADRERIWRQIWPAGTPVDPELDFESIARLQISGGNIKNIALAAAFLAVAEAAPVQLDHIITATRREYEKVGKALSNADVNRILQPEAVA